MIKSGLKFLKRLIKNPPNAAFYKKRYLFDKAFGKEDSISYIPDIFCFNITFQCNFRCPACTYLLKDKKAFDGKKYISLEDFNLVLDKFGKNIRQVTLSGGEPTLHPQFAEIVRSVKKRNFRLEMPTNGTIIKQRIEELKYFDKLSISLDGIGYQAFKKIRAGTEKQYNDIIEGIYLLRDKGIPFHLCFLLFEENLSEIERILSFAKKVRPALLKFNSFNPHGCQAFTPLIIDSPKVRDFLRKIMGKNDYPFSIRLPIIFDPSSEDFHKKRCPLLWSSCYIGWQGDIAPCCHLADNPQIGNIFQNYDFNSGPIVKFRKAMIENNFPADCLYCQNRFFGEYVCEFDATKKRWIIEPPVYKEILCSKKIKK